MTETERDLYRQQMAFMSTLSILSLLIMAFVCFKGIWQERRADQLELMFRQEVERVRASGEACEMVRGLACWPD